MHAIVPVASWASVWSTRSAISWPGTSSPRSRCSSRIVRASEAIASRLFKRDPGARNRRIRTVRALLTCLGVVLLATGCDHGSSLRGMGIAVRLPPGWHGRISKQRDPVPGAAFVVLSNATLRAKVTLAETLSGFDAPAEPARIEPGERRASVDRYVVKNGRAFWLHVTLGSGRSIKGVNAVLASL